MDRAINCALCYTYAMSVYGVKVCTSPTLPNNEGAFRPIGISAIRSRLAAHLASGHAVEHRMIEVLAGVLWEAQRDGHAADDALYLERLRKL